MKKIFTFIIMVLSAALVLCRCDDDEIVFDHELPAFDIKEGQILLEVIVPTETSDDDIIYIAGAFNGGSEAAAVSSLWQLEHSTTITEKWGIYLDPDTFVSGTDLSDGYWFVSTNDREERTALGDSLVRTETFKTGTRNNIYVSRWASYFDSAEEDSSTSDDVPRIYVLDGSGWDELALYTWGDDGDGNNIELFGSWPGSLPDGEETISGETYKYFNITDEMIGYTVNMIFNDNGAGNQFDAPQSYELTSESLFLSITSSSYEVLDDPREDSLGPAIYVLDGSGWDELALYTWGDDGDGNNIELFGSWPGSLPDGETTVDGETYKYFLVTDEMIGYTVNMIFNNNGGGSQFDAPQGYTLDGEDLYLSITSSSYEIINAEEEEEEEEDSDPATGYAIYVEDNSGWDALALYAWGDSEIFGSWPGALPDGETTVGGVTMKYFNITESMVGQTENLIFNNNNGGSQFDALSSYVIPEADVYLSITSSSYEEIDKPSDYTGYSVYVEDLTSWGITYVYGWYGSGSVTAAWPGIAAYGTVTINGYVYTKFEMGTDLTGESMNLIFNCNTSQLADYYITLDADYYFTADDSGVTLIEDPTTRTGVTEEFSVGATSISPSSSGGSQAVTISSVSSDWTVTTSDDWLYVTDTDGNTITSGSKSSSLVYVKLCADPNMTTSTREGSFVFTPGDGSGDVTVSVSQSGSSAPFLSKWVFDSDELSNYSVLWPNRHLLPATNSTAAYFTAERGSANSGTDLTFSVSGNNPTVGTMVADDYWLFTFAVSSLEAGSVIAFNATMAADKKAPKYWVVEWYDGGEWKCNSDDLRTATDDSNVQYTYMCSGDISTGSTDTYQYTTVMQTCKFDNAITDGEVLIRCRAVGSITCDGSTQSISVTSSNTCSMPDFGFTAAAVQNLGTSTPTESYKVLILGNSFSYYFHPVFMLQEIAWSQGKELKIKAHLKGSQRLYNHLSLELSQDAITEGDYDFAIIQDQSTNPAKYGEDSTTNASVSEYCTQLVNQILQYSPDCKVILDETWAYPASSYAGYGDQDTFLNYLKVGTLAMAKNAGTWVAPVGDAFAQSLVDHSSWSLFYSGDSKHATRSSAYLKTCVEYVTMFGEEFTGTVPVCEVNSTRAAYFQGLAEDLVIGNESDWLISR